MSVYTPLTQAELSAVLQQYGCTLVDAKAASHGIENSTFLLRATQAGAVDDAVDSVETGLVLTVFEQFNRQQLQPYLQVLAAVAQAGVPAPAPLATTGGDVVITVANKPAVVMPWLPGEHDFTVNEARCYAIGQVLAQLHAVPVSPSILAALPAERARLTQLRAHVSRLPTALQASSLARIDVWLAHGLASARRCLIHGDLFRDNVLWCGDALGAVLDFYNACADCPEYDLAVALNDWCVDANGVAVVDKELALLRGYRAAGGHYDAALLAEALPVAALRFWLSRLAGPVSSDSEGLGSKDPQEFARIYAARLAAAED